MLLMPPPWEARLFSSVCSQVATSEDIQLNLLSERITYDMWSCTSKFMGLDNVEFGWGI